jgi:predicted nucleotidyltransferase
MAIDDLRRQKREEILRITVKHGARNVHVFGSASRGEAGEGSEVDLLVEFEPGRTLLDRAGLVVELGDLLGRKVDVVTKGGLYWLLRRPILRRARPLTAKREGPAAGAKKPHVYLARIRECIEKIEGFTANWRERFFQGAMVQDAVLRNLDVIGEASAKGPNDDSRAHEPRGNRHAD